VQKDTTTKGSWKNVYGGDGYNIVNNGVSYPSYAQVSVIGYVSPTWNASTSDARALQKISNTDRIAARWESNSSFTISLNITDGQTHRVGIYVLDWDGNNRSERFDVIEAATGALLDTRTVSQFNGGQYLVWNIKGNVKITVTKTGGKSAVVSGLYFGNATATPGVSIMTISEDFGTAAALNAMTQTAPSFNVITELNFGFDKRTRINIFGTGITGIASNTNPTNDVMVRGVLRPNFAESISIEARFSDGRVFNLPVEFAGGDGVIPGLDQVTVVLIPELAGAGRVELTLIVNGQRSNAPTIMVQ
jgi:uncharacterized protein (TIGR03437 family)